MRTGFVFGLAAMASLVAVAVDVEFKDAKSGVVEMSGDGKGDVIKSRSIAYKVKTGALYGFEYMGREVGSGLIVAGSSAVNVDRHGPDAGWYEFRNAYQTPGAAGSKFDEVFHVGHYRGRGEFYFKSAKFHELRAEYAERGGVTLGHGESLVGGKYRFDTTMGGFSRNHFRPLLSYKGTTFNSSHWNIHARDEVVYCHELNGRAFQSGSVSVMSGYFTGKGPMFVEASADGASWQMLGSVTNVCTASFALPSAKWTT